MQNTHPSQKSSPHVPHSTSHILIFLCYAIPLIFLILFYFYPLLSIFQLSFAPEGRLDLSPLQRLVSSSYYLKTLWFTLWQATFSTALTLALALPAAYIFARYRFPGKSILRAITTIPFVLPTVVVAIAFTALLGPKGTVNQLLMTVLQLDSPPIQLQHSITMILLAHVFYNYTIVLRLVGGFWSNLNPQLSEAGQMLGASRWLTFRQITLPLLMPALSAAALLIFIFSFTSFGVVLILGGPRYATLEVEIYRQAVNLFNLPVAAALAIIQIVLIFGLMLVYSHLQARTSRPLDLKSQQAVQRVPHTWGEKLLVWGNIGFMLLLLGAPLLALVVRSLLVNGQLSLAYYYALLADTPRSRTVLFVSPLEGIFNSLTFALSTVLLALFLGLLVSMALTSQGRGNLVIIKRWNLNSYPKISATLYKRLGDWRLGDSISNLQSPNLLKRSGSPNLKSLFDTIFMLPLATSAVTLGFGYIIALNKPPLNLRTSVLLIVIAHTLVALPFVIRSLLPALRSIQPHWREAAAILGAAPLRVWREVDLPIASRALLVGAVFAFTISMGEFGATLFIARPDSPTMPVAIFRYLSQPGSLNYGQALAISTLLMLVCALGFLLIERFRVDNSEF